MVRYNAAVALGMMGKDTKGAMPGLLHGMEDQASWEIRRSPSPPLSRRARPRPAPTCASPRLVGSLLRTERPQVRLEAVLALGQMGRPDDGVLLDHTLREPQKDDQRQG